MADRHDVVAVGAGINALVLAALLTLRGRRVLVLEREDAPGGCMRTEEITVPGFRHDILALSVPAFVTAPHFPLLAGPLAAEGVTFLTAARPTAVLTPSGEALVLARSRAANVAAFDACAPGDGAAFARSLERLPGAMRVVGSLLDNPPRSPRAALALARLFWNGGGDAVGAFLRESMAPMRSWLERDFASPLPRALIAPWILHAGMDPDAPGTALTGRLLISMLEQVGAPVMQGGMETLVAALVRIVEKGGGTVLCGQDVSRVLMRGRRAVGVETAAGAVHLAARAVACDVTPHQLYSRLLRDTPVPPAVHARVDAYTYGRADMQIHIALAEPPQWRNPAITGVALTHISPGIDGVARAVTEARGGLLPREATIVVGQPSAIDPSRCPPGCADLWVQLQELPAHPVGDAAGLIAVDPNAGWTPELKASYAERIVDRLADAIPNLRRTMLGRAILSPADLEARNVNLVGGDPYSGDCALHQFHALRSGAGGQRTHIKALYHIGASTHPGPSLSGMSGNLAAAMIG